MAAHALTLACRIARYDTAAQTPPNVLAAWLRTPPSFRWAALDVLAAAGAEVTIGRIDALEAHVLDTARRSDTEPDEWTHGPYPVTEAADGSSDPFDLEADDAAP